MVEKKYLKKITQWGDSAVIVLTKENLEALNLKVGDDIDILELNKYKDLTFENSNKEMLKSIKKEVKK